MSMLVTAGTMILVSLVAGWEKRKHLLREEIGTWLRASQTTVRQLERDMPTHHAPQSLIVRWLPAVVAIGCFLSYVVFW